MPLKQLQQLATAHGLILRGAFQVTAEDEVPNLSSGAISRTLVLFGNAGSSIWPPFSHSPEYLDGLPDPLDRWSSRIAESMARQFNCLALYPFGGPPYHPFSRWAQKAEPVTPSPLLMQIHPTYGLWHAYRFALALAEPVKQLTTQTNIKSPCSQCREKPCLQGCPVAAFGDGHYHSERCIEYLEQHPEGACMNGGCLARVACPEGSTFRYQPAHAQFHMRAFICSQGKV